jgi:hypothetical protein
VEFFEDEQERRKADAKQMRDDWGKDKMWRAVMDLAADTVGVLDTYSSGYYYWHVGRYLGRSIVEVVIIVDWLVNYEVLQPYFAQIF